MNKGLRALGRLKAGVQICTHCKAVKSIDEFYKYKRNGKQCVYKHCKSCQNAKTKSWRAMNPERSRELNAASKARNHAANMDRQRASRAASGSRPESKEAKERRIARSKERRKDPSFISAERAARKAWIADPKNRARYNAWQANRRARQRQAEGSFLADEWIRLCERAGWRCLCCSAKCVLTVDHVIPLSLGGSNHIENIQPLCGPCNSSKGVKLTDYRKALDE